MLAVIYFSGISPNPFDMKGLGDSLNDGSSLANTAKRRSPHAFLGENSGLVNLDNLVTKPTQPSPNPQQPLRPGITVILYIPFYIYVMINNCIYSK